ncbi:MAG: CHAT domain-containing protein [Trichodesmium sp. MAG_R03]|nr:CHAT domain-containing protein [Trichodesmium sp. MAG_R03]
MEKNYYTYCIRVANYDRVQVEKRNPKYQDFGRPFGVFRYHEKFQQIEPMLEMARDNSLNDTENARALGEVLFDVLFDDGLVHDFVGFYREVVQQKEQLLRVELDIDEAQMPEVAALPWEFLRVPKRANLGTIWMGTLPNLVLYRRRSQWNPPPPIQLARNERLKIALVVSAPPDLKPVAYERVQKTLDKLATEQAHQIELLPILNSANAEEIDAILSKKPHIFHFIGHGRLIAKGDREVGEIALVDPDFDEAMWVDADYFSGLFSRHCPSVVMLQACEGGKLSGSQAFTGVASAIIQQNIPVVVAMQYEVTNSTASRFARCFYKKLAEYKPVGIAAQEGRYAIAKASTQDRKRDFATPIIFMGVEDGSLFKSSVKSTEKLRFTDIVVRGSSKGNQENSPDLDFSGMPLESIQEAYRRALPPDANLWADGNLEENDISQILERLKKFGRMEVFYQVLSQDKNLSPEMSQKIQAQVKKYPEENKARETGNFFSEEQRYYLIITISSEPADNNQFTLHSWLVMGEHEDYYEYPNNCQSLLNSNETESGIKCQLSQVENFIDRFIQDSSKYYILKKGLKKLTIEIFLPINLLHTEVEWWNLTDINNSKTPIGTMYPVRLRSVERLDTSYLSKRLPVWQTKWYNAKSVLKQRHTGQYFGHFDLIENENFIAESLIDELDEKIGFKSTSCPPQQKRKDLFKAILKSAIPIALWTRYNCPNRHQEIEKLLNLQPLNCLCDSIKKKRMNAVAQKDEIQKKQHLGSHLAVIWENPYRLTPDAIARLIAPGQ